MRHPSLASRVKAGNRIRFDELENRAPLKEKISVADLPELVLTVRSMTANLNNTTSTSSCTRQYAWMLSAGDYRYSQIMSPIEWALFAAMSNWRDVVTALLWRDKSFVKRVQLLGGSSGLSDPAQNRNIIGWSAVWAVEVEMHFAQTDLDLELLREEET